MTETLALRSFGRRQGRKLRPQPQRLVEETLPGLLYSLLPQGETWLEIGFGGGEHLAALAQMHPEVNFIGAEPYMNGVASLLEKIQQQGLKNIRIVPDDIRPVMEALPEGALQRVYLLFPDPWPKPRHHKRRIVNQSFLDSVARVLKPGGILQLATDHADYSVWMLEQLLQRKDFIWQADSCRDWHEPPQGWTPTRYETKTRAEGRQPVYLRLIRLCT